jgi:hypothetical protein
MPKFFKKGEGDVVATAHQLKIRIDNCLEQPEKDAARQKLHDFLETHPEMGPDRYQTFLNQQGPDIKPLNLC